MSTDITPIGLPMPFAMGKVNCYLVGAGEGHVLIDSGGSSSRRELVRALELAGCAPGRLDLIVLTHGDFDHIGNAAHLRTVFGCRIAMHPDDWEMAQQGDMFANRRRPNVVIRTLLPVLGGFGPSQRFTPDLPLEDSEDLSPYGLPARVISLPGHSRGSIGILTGSGDLFCGDLLENVRRPSLGSIMDDPKAARDSLARLKGLEIGMVYPGHGTPFRWDQLAAGPVGETPSRGGA